MSKNQKNYYAVAKGVKPGLYKTWGGANGAEAQVKGVEGAVYKGFYDLADALDFLDKFGVHVPEHDTFVPKENPFGDDYVQIYADGSSIQNPGPGGYGAVLTFKGKTKELSAGFRETTNNRMEMMACIVGLGALKQPSKVVIYSDSKYVVDSVTKGWAERWRLNGWKNEAKKIVENADLWRLLLDAINKHDVSFVWVKGHAGKRENERADELAQKAARGSDLAVDKGYEDSRNSGLF